MEILQWNEVLATGIREIDEQHKRIVEIVRQLREAIERGAFGESEAAEVALLQVVDYTVYHFEFEEKLMEKAGYQPLPLHRRVHQLFIRRIAQFQQRYAAGEDVLRELHNMLARWLVRHIQHDDRDYAPIVKAYLRREAKRNPSRYRKTEPLPLHEPPPKPPARGANQASGRRRRTQSNTLWGRLSSFMGGAS